MPEDNGTGRLDRIEALLEAMIQHHNAEFKQLLTWQVLMQDKMNTLHADVQQVVSRVDGTNLRVDNLVAVIMKLVDRMPNPHAIEG